MSRPTYLEIFLICFILSPSDVLVFGARLSQQTTNYNCPICELLKTLVSKQNTMEKKMEEISRQNTNLERKIDVLLGTKANCSAGKTLTTGNVFWL